MHETAWLAVVDKNMKVAMFQARRAVAVVIKTCVVNVVNHIVVRVVRQVNTLTGTSHGSDCQVGVLMGVAQWHIHRCHCGCHQRTIFKTGQGCVLTSASVDQGQPVTSERKGCLTLFSSFSWTGRTGCLAHKGWPLLWMNSPPKQAHLPPKRPRPASPRQWQPARRTGCCPAYCAYE